MGEWAELHSGNFPDSENILPIKIATQAFHPNETGQREYATPLNQSISTANAIRSSRHVSPPLRVSKMDRPLAELVPLQVDGAGRAAACGNYFLAEVHSPDFGDVSVVSARVWRGQQPESIGRIRVGESGTAKGLLRLELDAGERIGLELVGVRSSGQEIHALSIVQAPGARCAGPKLRNGRSES